CVGKYTDLTRAPCSCRMRPNTSSVSTQSSSTRFRSAAGKSASSPLGTPVVTIDIWTLPQPCIQPRTPVPDSGWTAWMQRDSQDCRLPARTVCLPAHTGCPASEAQWSRWRRDDLLCTLAHTSRLPGDVQGQCATANAQLAHDGCHAHVELWSPSKPPARR